MRRSLSVRSRLRIRIAFGVTSTSSSSAIHSMAVSSVCTGGGVELDRLVVGVGADVGLLLLPDDVDHHVVRAGALADDHALVDLARPGRRTARPAAGGCRGRSRWSSPVRSATMAPPVRWGSSPAHGIQPAWCWCSSAVPRVAVSSSERKPEQPAGRRLEGDDRAAGVAGAQVGARVPLRGASAWVTVPTCSSGTSTTRPLQRLVAACRRSRAVITSGRLTWSS